MIQAMLLAIGLARAAAAAPADTALLTYESGVLVAANWIERRGDHVRSRAELMQSGFRETEIELGPGETALHSSTRVWDAGGKSGAPIERALGADVVYWSDQIPSSIEQVVLRARALGQPTVTVAGASLYHPGTVPIAVTRVDSTDWVLDVNRKHYLVLTDEDGHVLSASMPDYGVVIERRIGFTPAQYPAWAPNDAAPGAPYRAQSVRITEPQGHVLAGTLTVPDGAGPFPAAVLITGLSPSDRNGGSPPWMPLRDVADALSRRGIAVLRVDDRGIGESTGDHAPSTTFDEADDVRTELAWLRARRGIAAARIVLVGYSEGGLIAPMVASTDRALAGIVTMAGPGVGGWEVARYQIEAAVVRDTSIAPSRREAEIARQLADTLTAREKSYLGIDPLRYARRVRCPALIVQGAADLHVPVRSAERLAWAMREAGNRDVSVRLLPGVSHSFLPDPPGLDAGWVALPGFMTSPEALRAIAEWATAHTAVRRARTP
ncbi:MAG TPA: alpha/beta fold hydrolase [Gemmatimonadales bacterium]|nr:alpha/beta fold hydrolase [Gemmatimonadales bacterium]